MSNEIDGRAKLGARIILEAFGVDEQSKRACSFAFSSRPVPPPWKAYTFDLPFAFYYVYAPNGSITQIRSLALGIRSENYVLLAEFETQAVLILRRSKKEDSAPLLVPLRKEEDYERVVNAIKKFNFVSDVLSAHSSINSVADLLRAGAERYYTNRGLFSNYYLRERLPASLSERGRNAAKESTRFLLGLGGEMPTSAKDAPKILVALGYEAGLPTKPGYPEYSLRADAVLLDASCIVASVESLDTKTEDKAAASFQAVGALKRFTWVILTNGRLWRLYSSRVSSSSTNYFEVDLEGVVTETDPKLVYFVSLFSSSSLLPRQGTTDLDLALEGGLRYAKEIEDDLNTKVFEGQLFLNLARAVLSHSTSTSYDQEQLDDAKSIALKLLYRLLFILYAESRGLLPVEDDRYKEISLESLRQRLSAFEKQPDATSVWTSLRLLFSTISRGNHEVNVPQYDGALFTEDPALDGLSIENAHLIPALRDLTEAEGRGIDYQNLGVRHLGSLYEALLQYSVRQAEKDLVIHEDEILDAQYVADQEQKPRGFIQQGELFLSVGGLARKGTGSYYTPDEIVSFLVRKGLEPHLRARGERFKADLELLRNSSTPNPELEKKCTDDLLGLKVVDPAMGSGHFLVKAVDEITRWIIDLLRENPDAPLVRQVEEYRREIVDEQRKKGIRLDEDLLTDTVILKRMVMKRCVYGVDVNPLAVELAKLSLWLDSFTIGTPLTFLDHHVRCGDSLIGLWLQNIASTAFQNTLRSWMDDVSTAGHSLSMGVSMPADLTVEQVTRSREAYDVVREETEPYRVLLDMTCAGVIDPELGEKLPRNLELVKQTCAQKTGVKPKWWSRVEDGLKLAAKYGFFHWELEFPDAFTRERRGFDLIIMNPPWDAVKPDDDEFFTVYYPRFRRIGSKPEKRKIMKSLLDDQAISNAYDSYRFEVEERLRFFKESGQYVRRGSGDTNLWKLFLERVLNLAGKDGSFALVIPSGIVTDEGGKQLRDALFEGRIRAMFEFENTKGIFPEVHRSYKFVLLIADKTTPTDTFPAAFYLHEIEALQGKAEQEKFVEIPVELVKISAPESLSIPEVRNKGQLEVFTWLYRNHPLLNDEKKGWSVVLIRELDRTADSDLFRSDGEGWPLIEGKHFHQFTPDFEKTVFTVNPREGLARTSKHKEYRGVNDEIHRTVRLAFRDVASSTNVRSMIACILPPESFGPNTAVMVLPQKNGSPVRGKEYLRFIAYLSGIFNSFVFDFLMRSRITMHLNYFYVNQTPIPSTVDGNLAEEIVRVSSRLSAVDNRFDDFASALDVQSGPLTMRERIDLTAKLNALVAKHYGLDKERLKVILQSFEGFEEDRELEKMQEVRWNDVLIRKFNGEVRRRVLPYFDHLDSKRSAVMVE